MITIISNTSSSVFSSPLGGGVQTSPIATQTTTEAALGTTGSSATQMIDLSDVNKTGLNDNDVLVYDALSGTFKPLDIDVINNNDGGTW